MGVLDFLFGKKTAHVQSQTVSVLPDSIPVVVHQRDGVLFEGETVAIESENEAGPLSILPGHSNFISLLSSKVVLHLADGQEQTFEIDSALIRVFESQAVIFLGAAEDTTK